MRSRSTTIAALFIAVLAAGCTATDSEADETASTTTADVTTTTSLVDILPGPERQTTRAVASSAITVPDGYSYRNGSDPAALELADIAVNWVPTRIVTEIVYEILETPSADVVTVVSVIPTIEWRGAPDLPEMLVELLSGSAAAADENRIVETESVEGDPMFLWSTGDGFLIVLAEDTADAVDYLSVREAERSPNAVWGAGACLMLPEGQFPYAPFPLDLVVSCTEPHNAEVIAAEYTATTATTYDPDAVEFDRTYACDEAYSTTFGPDISHRPGLVTYMPDEAEWDRGDRYRACVVTISSRGTTEVFEGRMQERDDLEWQLEQGECLPSRVKETPLPCSSLHVHEFMGYAEVPFEDWPSDGEGAFDAACDGYLEDVIQGPAEIDVWAYGLGPYEFDQGARTVRCLAFALGDTAPTLISGSFTDSWRIVGDAVGV